MELYDQWRKYMSVVILEEEDNERQCMRLIEAVGELDPYIQDFLDSFSIKTEGGV
ncbi:hypothetical protein PAK_P100046 [Pseudomonas phage PAK_P1]|nr:hypothetical protein PAK_P100046 [Pseudomonas phage PAK_P1]YP_007236495.1 hypothetical protein PaP1_gp084 [Pseudomonas phage PaP1]YP_008857086.1 hypothetical protein X831_gp046 [Pseudomonas phage PAK_P2]YP_009200032.1 hypothetical protein K8_096 [Pseudomonas phage K8]YP_009224786.1 hypothetical protein PaoP5_095 [Pseudomonas phage PaoP5]YP_009273850.1 hypothetical protein BH773_gp133 [Pseudomonas phage K5]YP_009291146.1 hypothetical protein BI047_gp112 [Pseudomonas phage phiMK]YP_00959814